MTDTGKMKIADEKSPEDWLGERPDLDAAPECWKSVLENYFIARLSTRYLEPIKLLKDHLKDKGEGFAIVTLQCALIEFLQTLRDGSNFDAKLSIIGYDPKNNDDKYNNASKQIFTIFLTEQTPFKEYFDEEMAEDFYKNVRCSLLHEACTTNNWRIRTSACLKKTITKKDDKTYLQRDRFQDDLETYISQYKIDLLSDDELKEAFIRKFNALCDFPSEEPETDAKE